MSQSSFSRQSGVQQNKKNLLFIICILVAAIAAVIVISRSALESAHDKLLSNLEQSMSSKAQNRAAQLTVWFGSITDQAGQLSARDQVRLFASEMFHNGVSAQETRKYAESAQAGNNTMFSPDAGGMSEKELLKAQAPLLLRQFKDFLSGIEDIACVSLLSPKGEWYISTHASEDMTHTYYGFESMAVSVAATGRMEVGPVRLFDDGRLVMDIALPVYAPLYVDASGAKTVGVLLLASDVTRKVGAMTQLVPAGGNDESFRIIQAQEGELSELTLNGDPLVILKGWTLDESGSLPMAARTMPPRRGMPAIEVFSLAVPVSGLPWLVHCDIPVDQSMAPYEDFRTTVLISAFLISVMIALVLGMLWWWMLGRQERAVANEIRALYETVNRQKQIIDSVNTTLGDGIVLVDMEGRIPYANHGFARMAEENAEAFSRKSCGMLNSAELARNLLNHISVVKQTGAPHTFAERLHVLGQPRHYQVACTPLRAENGVMLGVVSVYRDITSLVEAQERAQHMVNQTVHVFVRAIEAVDPYLRGQSTQTGVLSVALAERLGYAEHADTLRTAANLCQVGMIQLPHQLLTKTGSLTLEERQELQKHIEYAHNALEGIDFGLPVLDAIMQMHERLDGSGYPRRLSEGDIHIDGRILAVAATFCALLRPRSYRQAKTMADAMGILSTTPPQYDQNVVEALRGYLETPEGKEFLQELTRQ